MGLYSEQNSYKHSTQTMRLRWGACDNTVWLLYFTCSTPQQCTAMMLLNKCHVFLISAWSYSNIDECAQLMKYSCFYEECSGDSDPGTTAKYHGMTNTVSHMAHIWEACRSIQVKNLHLGSTSLGRSTPVYYPSYQQCQLPPYHMKPPQRKGVSHQVSACRVCLPWYSPTTMAQAVYQWHKGRITSLSLNSHTLMLILSGPSTAFDTYIPEVSQKRVICDRMGGLQ